MAHILGCTVSLIRNRRRLDAYRPIPDRIMGNNLCRICRTQLRLSDNLLLCIYFSQHIHDQMTKPLKRFIGFCQKCLTHPCKCNSAETQLKKMDKELDLVHGCLTELYNLISPTEKDIQKIIRQCLEEIKQIK